MISRSDTARTRDGLTLSLRHWPANATDATRGVIPLVHGLGEHIGRYDRLAKKLTHWGWSVVGYDQREHGNSPSKRGVNSEQISSPMLYLLSNHPIKTSANI